MITSSKHHGDAWGHGGGYGGAILENPAGDGVGAPGADADGCSAYGNTGGGGRGCGVSGLFNGDGISPGDEGDGPVSW
jgi:hypothetical protein